MYVNSELRKQLSENHVKKLEKKKKFLILQSYERHIKNMSDAEAGYLFKCMLDYICHGQDFEMKDPKMAKIQLLFEDFKAENTADILDWLQTSNKNRENVNKRWDKAKNKTSDIDKYENPTKHPIYG